ncbi:GlxA family transcriptional regulator [Sedimenticola thiotaurini]|uniref:AraC family transcriptional regulator n=1 Tax=Sedimenticola thiotaurini TaxID=1543721 RepID=A0A0F7JT30_9GAMM|nr:helix-turn-helix domain-containing protein [Sedimenticola thiotaurini]AKH19581.1 AraC family transcriptional regulator [Sedimenticola thiotaurini]
MKKITLLCFDYAFSSVITGVLDLFSLVGVTWNRVHNQPPASRFQVQLAAEQQRPIRCLNRLTLQPDLCFASIRESDIVFIPPIGADIDRTLESNRNAIDWLREMHATGSQIVSSCTGSFLLAETGLLDGKQATTHWGYIDQFRQRYPRVILKPAQLITNEVDLLCAAGGSAWLDLSLLLIQQHAGQELALQTAKALVIERKQHSQAAFTTSQGQKYHQDAQILSAQEWMESHLAEKISIDRLGERCGMAPRTFKRRFKQATGDSPLAYLQSLRIERAKKILESSQIPIEQITRQVGYEDSSSFMKLFKRTTGMSPQQYRTVFSHVQHCR